MLYMVVEHYKPGALSEIYRRVRERGRMLPDGLEYVSSWVSVELTTCYQLMRSDDRALFSEWMNAWKDLVDVEIVPVRTSAETSDLLAQQT